MSDNDTERAIEKIRQVTAGDKTQSAAVSLINLIPYAGGAIASLITDYASQQKTKKICDVLSDLNERLESHNADPSEQLDNDQVVELIHQTLASVALASDKTKIKALKNGLAYSFIETDRFENKQIFLDTLRNTSILELAVMRVIYESSDPYIIREGKKEEDITKGFIATSVTTTYETWEAEGNRECSQPELAKHLAERLKFEISMIEGVAHLLDGRGLTSMASHLKENQCKVMKLVNPLTIQVIRSTSIFGNNIQPTPIEASRTDFGRNFMRFCNYL